MKRCISIFPVGGEFNVIRDGLSTGPLTWGEMLETVAELTHPQLGTPHYAMLRPAQWSERKTRQAAKRAGS